MENHVFKNNWKSDTPKIVRGKGIYLYDKDGKGYIDGSSGSISSSLAHGRVDMAETLRKQAETLAYVTRLTSITPLYEEVSSVLADNTHMDRFFLTSGGSEAVEVATKIALSYQRYREKPNKTKILSRWLSYHGCTSHTMSIGGNVARRSDYISQLTEDGHIAPPLCYHCWFGKERNSCNCECAEALETEILMHGPENIAGFIFETIGGSTTGAATPPLEYYKKIREICDKYDVLVIADEIMCGYGRTGKMLALEHYGIKPDIVVLAKSMGGGYFPVGAVGTTEEVAAPIKAHGSFMGGYTWGSNPIACATVIQTTKIIHSENLLENVTNMGALLKSGLEDLMKKHPTLGDVRGIGLMVCTEFVKDKNTRESFDPEVNFTGKFINNAREEGLLLNAGSKYNKGIRGDGALIGPCFEVSKEEIEIIVDRVDKALSNTEKEVL
ncbi:MAG: aminotransferase class III-fold pyridoxal phosphate-dependent enzyme [Parabacteroides sp.]|nr:aminotransferase class III-fold pyridoxal phosphate-dependent enzyme [Parabacteroides sp.]